jgi:Protein of unknown function (DUF2726)
VNNQLLTWIAIGAGLIIMPLITVVFLRGRQPTHRPLPTDWALAPRAVFTSDERRIYRLLREALPHHVILSKLPLVRFCQPTDPQKLSYWYGLLASSSLTFAICSANGRVLAGVDLDAEHGGPSKRSATIKKSVLQACRVRHMVCKINQLPSIADLQMLVPHSGVATRSSMVAPSANLDGARDQLAGTVANRRAQRSSLWQDSAAFQDSFFAMDSRFSPPSVSDFLPMTSTESAPPLESEQLAARRNQPS